MRERERHGFNRTVQPPIYCLHDHGVFGIRFMMMHDFQATATNPKLPIKSQQHTQLIHIL